jgi:hypothetical protein
MSMKHEKQQPAQLTSKVKGSLDGNYPGLNAISWGIGYLEQTLSVISEPLLLVCAAIAVIDSITGGHLMEIGLINYTWAASLAIAVTACFIVTWRRSLRAFGYNRYGAGIGLAFLGSLLGVVDLAAIAIQALQQALNISFAQALAMLNLNIVVMTYIRSCVAIAMAVVVAVSNNTAVTAAQAPKRRLAFLEKALNTLAPVVSDEQSQSAQVVSTSKVEQSEDTPSDRLVNYLGEIFGYIYALVNPKDDMPFYVGQTVDLPTRSNEHMLRPPNEDNMRIIDQLNQEGLKPRVEVLEKVQSKRDLNTRERYWIETLTARGHVLTNRLEPATNHHYTNKRAISHIGEIDLSKPPQERVKQALGLYPTCSDRLLGKLTNLSAATAKKYRQLLSAERSEVSS